MGLTIHFTGMWCNAPAEIAHHLNRGDFLRMTCHSTSPVKDPCYQLRGSLPNHQ